MIGLIGFDYHRTPAAARERLALCGERRDAVMRRLAALPEVDEALVLSTCLRTEVYVATRAWEAVSAQLERLLLEPLHDDPGTHAHLYRLVEEDTADHLFRVTAGLRSLV